MNVIGTKLRDLINSRLTRWRMAVYKKWTSPWKAGGIPRVSTRFSLSVENEQTGADGTAKPVSRDQILRREREQGNTLILSAQLTMSRFGNLTGLIRNLMTTHTYCTCTYSSTGTFVLLYICTMNVCVCVCVFFFFPFILDVRLVDVPAGVTQEEVQDCSSHFPSAVLALIFSREKDSAVPFPRRP